MSVGPTSRLGALLVSGILLASAAPAEDGIAEQCVAELQAETRLCGEQLASVADAAELEIARLAHLGDVRGAAELTRRATQELLLLGRDCGAALRRVRGACLQELIRSREFGGVQPVNGAFATETRRLLAALMLPAVQKVTAAASRTCCDCAPVCGCGFCD